MFAANPLDGHIIKGQLLSAVVDQIDIIIPEHINVNPVFFSEGAWQEAGVYRREDLSPGARITGPAVLIESHQTIVIEPGWSAEITAKNHDFVKRDAQTADFALAMPADSETKLTYTVHYHW